MPRSKAKPPWSIPDADRKLIVLERKLACVKSHRDRLLESTRDLAVRLSHANAQIAELQLYLHEENIAIPVEIQQH